MENLNFNPCDHSCPIMNTCIKYKLTPEDSLKLHKLIQDYIDHEPGYKFAQFIGRFVKKMRKNNERSY